MSVINKKRITLIATCLILGIFVYSLGVKEINTNEEIVQTTATPVSGKTVVLDAGHGKPDERCRK